MKEIEITIAPDGTVSAVIAGVKGPACKVLAQELARILAVLVGRDEFRQHLHVCPRDVPTELDGGQSEL